MSKTVILDAGDRAGAPLVLSDSGDLYDSSLFQLGVIFFCCFLR